MAVAAAVVVIAVVAVVLSGGSAARSQLEDFLAAWEAERYDRAAALTDAGRREVRRALEENRDGLDGATLTTEVLELEEDGGAAHGRVRLSWDVPVVGTFEYAVEIALAKAGDDWAVQWSPQVVHSELEAGQRLGTARDFGDRRPILDRRGRALVSQRPVVDIGIVPEKLEDREAALAALETHADVDPRPIRRALRAAAPKQFVAAITLRDEEFVAIHDALDRVPGIEFANRMMPLASTRAFARALLGTVAAATAEQLEELGEPYGVGDEVGQWGLQAAFERELGGTPTARVLLRGPDGIPLKVLRETEGRPGRALRTTIDSDVQEAAEDALGARRGNAAIVALEPSSGDVLAVANRPVDDTFNRAFEGRYPPGSTFKVVSTAALLDEGLDPADTVACPSTITVGGRRFRNFEGTARGAVPFRTDFAYSCNTAFVSLADRLEDDALPQMAERFGLGRQYELALRAFGGDVPRATSPADRGETVIGQGRVLVSPLALAGVAGTVAAGRWQQPRLTRADPRRSGPRLPDDISEPLRSLMRDVVEYGTGTAASGAPGAIAGKTGTAEFGGGDPPRTHAWFIAFRRDLAIAVLVENAPSGGEVAAPIAAEFFAHPGLP